MTTAFRETSAIEKGLTSLANVAVAAVFLLPFLFWGHFSILELKGILIGLFFLENMIAILFFDYRLPGMVLQNTRWKRHYSKSQQRVHALLYTASFSTVLF